MIQQIKEIPFFRSLNTNKIEKIVSKIKVEHYNNNEVIIKEGDEGDKLYIIKHGKVKIFIKDKFIKALEAKAYFGERALFFDEKRSATIISDGFIEVLTLEKDEFKILLETNFKEFIINKIVLQDVKASVEELDVIKEISCNNYSRILLVKHIKTKYLYILKQIPKESIYNEKLLENIILQSDYIKKLDNPFLLNLVHVFKHKNNLFCLVEYARGKSLDTVLLEIGLLNKYQTVFYTACIMYVINYLHDKDIIYRDVRPANVIVLENVI